MRGDGGELPDPAGPPSGASQVPPSLHRQWWIVTVTSALGLTASLAALLATWPRGARGAAVVAGLWVVGVSLLRRGLPLNRRHRDGKVLPALGAGTGLSLLRAGCLSLLAGFLVAPLPPEPLLWVPALLYTAAAGLDYYDGRVARRAGQVTLLGTRLDLELDSLGVLLAVGLGTLSGKLPWWYLTVGVARYAFTLGQAWRRHRRKAVADLPPSYHRRLFAGLQMGYLSAALWPVVPAALSLATAPLFAGATLTLFLRDWLVVCRRIDPGSARWRDVEGAAEALFFGWVPVALRLALVAVFVLDSRIFLTGPGLWRGVLEAWGLATSAFDPVLAVALYSTFLVASAGLLLGIGGRPVAFGVVVLLSQSEPASVDSGFTTLAVALTSALLILGLGRVLGPPGRRELTATESCSDRPQSRP